MWCRFFLFMVVVACGLRFGFFAECTPEFLISDQKIYSCDLHQPTEASRSITEARHQSCLFTDGNNQ
jgi:hypothetical protein